MEEQLKKQLSEAIAEFNKHRARILIAAQTSGGQEAVRKVEEEYDALRDAYYELIKRELDQNNHLYEQLISAANSETVKLKETIANLEDINTLINLTTSVFNLVGRIIIVLGI